MTRLSLIKKILKNYFQDEDEYFFSRKKWAWLKIKLIVCVLIGRRQRKATYDFIPLSRINSEGYYDSWNGVNVKSWTEIAISEKGFKYAIYDNANA